MISDMFRKDLSERNPEAHFVISGFMSGESKFSSGAVDFVQNNLLVWIINFDQHSQSSISISDNSDCHRDELRVIFSRHHGFLRHFFNKTSSFLKIEIVLKLYINEAIDFIIKLNHNEFEYIIYLKNFSLFYMV